MVKKNTSSVAVILGFYNGNKYILEQIDSIICQTHKNISIFIFDDNSNQKIIKNEIYGRQKFKNQIKIIRRKSNLGYSKNFLHGLKKVKDNFDYYAFCDQDDIWEKDKIEEAIKTLNNVNNLTAYLYFSRTKYFNIDCTKEIGSSKIFKRPTVFSNAILQNIAGGNTIVLNKKAKEIISKTIKCKDYISHDWWCYLIVSAAGGKIIFNEKKTVRYRQHNDNLIGMNSGTFEKVKRLISFVSGKYQYWLEVNIRNLRQNEDIFSKENLKVLDYFSNARKSRNLIRKIVFFIKSGVYRQSKIETIILTIGLLLNKI